jgi:DNA-binding SARP family transcriptional activator
MVPAPEVLTETQLAAMKDPAVLLNHAWALEPPLRLQERYAALDRLQELLDAGGPPPAPKGRSWQLELLAERAIDAVSNIRLDEARELAERVLKEAAPEHRIAIARATLAHARIFAWIGTDEATARADRLLGEAAAIFAAMGHSEWQGYTTFWRGYAVHFQTGNLPRAAELIGEGLEILGPDSPRRSTIISFYADSLIELGEFDAAEAILAEGLNIADRDDDAKSRSFIAWSRAHIASVRGDPLATERLLREVTRGAGDWFETHIGIAFLVDAAQYLDRVGLTDEARTYYEQARTRVPASDEAILLARATLLGRSGDPVEALTALQELARGDWLEKRLVWRNTLLTAWATFRAGRGGAGELAARAVEQAVACGGLRVALAGERELTLALAPLAEQAGSASGRELMLDGRDLIVRLFGTPRVTRADGAAVELPPGKPGELVRLLALHEHGLPADVVLETFFPDATATAARQRLRQVLTRLRAAAGEVVVRDGETLRLLPAWVDVREFQALTEHARGICGPRAIQLAYAALALRIGPLLPSDPYAPWAEGVRDQVEYRHLTLLDLIAAEAAKRGSHQEALTALEAARAADPEDHHSRDAAIAQQLLALGRHGTAEYVSRLNQ